MRKSLYGFVGIAVGLIYYIFAMIGMPLIENVNSSSSDFHLVNKDYSKSLKDSKGGSITTIFDYGGYHLLDNEFSQYESSGLVKYGKLNPMFYYIHSNPEPKEGDTSLSKENSDTPKKREVDNKSVSLKDDNDEADKVGLGGGSDKKTKSKVSNELEEKTTKGYNIEEKTYENIDVSLQLYNFANEGVMPVDDNLYKISSSFGERKDPLNGTKAIHTGLDISSEGISGSNVYSATDGVVELAKEESSGYGNHVIINHGSYKTVYAHLESFSVSKGDLVSTGDTIGKVGSTGRSTGPHLHFEVRIGNVSVDPTLFIERLEEIK